MTTGTSAVVEIRPSGLIDALTADFQRRAEPQFAWKSLVSQLVTLPGLRGFWPMSSVYYSASPRVPDASGQGNDLDDNNTVTFGYDNLIPYAGFTAASTQYLDRADGGAANWADIIGTESYIVGPQQGLTMGGWFYADTLTGRMIVMCKGDDAANVTDSYKLIWRGDLANNNFYAVISSGALYEAQLSSVTCAVDLWYFAVMRFTPSTTIDIFVNGTWDSNAAVTAALNDCAVAFTIGASGAPGSYLDGRASMCFLCATALSDAIVGQLYEQSRVAYGVLS